MKNLRPLLSVNSAPANLESVSKVPYDIMKVARSKFLPGSLPTGFCLVPRETTQAIGQQHTSPLLCGSCLPRYQAKTGG